MEAQMTDFQIDDRVITSNNNKDVSPKFAGQVGTVVDIDIENDHVRVHFDNIEDPNGMNGWSVANKVLTLVETEPTADEIADLFGIGPGPIGPDSTRVELLEHIDNALRNGTKMTRANLAFEFLLKSLDLTRLDLPSYVHDMQEDK